ncbi:MAG: tRNA lysidine(34) synthetase TilS [Verrucomicrobiota bacterium]
MHPVAAKIRRALDERDLLPRGAGVLVGVSGGLDSTVLLHLLAELAPRYGWKLAAAHLNHGLRGRSSDADERFVCAQARKLGIEVVSETIDAGLAARRLRVSIEMAGRRLRHEFLARTAARLGIRHVALAHHADDRVELFFLRLFRGSGPEGLAGLKWTSPSPAEPKIRLVRPLLEVAKSDLREYARDEGIRFRNDRSNEDRGIARNRIRGELLPLLRKHYAPAIDRVVLRTVELCAAESALAMRLAAEWLFAKKRAVPFGELDLAVQRRCIQIQLFRLGVEPGFELTEELRLARAGKAVRGPKGVVLRIRSGEVSRVDGGAGEGGEAFAEDEKAEIRLGTAKSGRGRFGGLEFSWGLSKGRVLPRGRAGFEEYFDADEVGRRLILRHWRRGTGFSLFGTRGPVKVQDLLVNARIPRAQRHRLVMLTTGGGEIVWIQGLRISERFKLTDRTNRRLQWRWKQL